MVTVGNSSCGMTSQYRPVRPSKIAPAAQGIRQRHVLHRLPSGYLSSKNPWQ